MKGLETAYNRIAMASVRDLTDEHKLELEKFVAEIQLYGTPHQIELMQAMVTAYSRDPRIDFDPILEDLRNTLRKELRMEPVKGPVWWLRFKTPDWKLQDNAAQQGAPADGPRATRSGRG